MSTGRTWRDHEWTEVDGRLLHAAAAGAPGSPTVVLVHGQGVSHRYLTPLAERLAGSARVVGLDLPGFGRSRCPEPVLDLRALSTALVRWLEATGRAGAVVLGHSTGCQVVADAAAHSPEVLGRVVLAGATVDAGARSWPQQTARLLTDLVLERPDLLPVLVGDYFRCGSRRFVLTFDHMLSDRIEDKLPLLRGPTVVVRGQWDPVSPRAWNRELLDRLPDGRLVEVPRGGHNIGWTRAGGLARVVQDVVAAAVADGDAVLSSS